MQSFAKERLVEQDSFMFKILSDVVSFKEIQADYVLLNDLKCFYPESFLYVMFEDLMKQSSNLKLESLQSNEINYSEDQIGLFKKYVNFYKLRSYVDSLSVVVSPDLVTGFYAMAKKSKCRLAGFKNTKTLTDRLEQIVKIEIFVRSRFISQTEELTLKIKQSANLFLESVSKQITEEVFW